MRMNRCLSKEIAKIDMPNHIFSIMLNMLQKSVQLDCLPVPVVEYGCNCEIEEVKNILYMAFTEYNVFSRYTRRQKIYLQVPLYENAFRFKEFFELFNSYSQFQNCTYGLCELDFRKWIDENNVNIDAVIQLEDFISRNKGNCLFILTGVPLGLVKELMGNNVINFIPSNMNVNVSAYIEEYCRKFHIAINKSECVKLMELLEDKSFDERGNIMRNLVNEIYQGNNPFENLDNYKNCCNNGVSIGFHI